MRTLKSILILVVIVGISTIFSCTKEGEKGEAGVNGVDGQDGNANVIATNTSTTNNGNWILSGNFYYADFTIYEISQNIVDYGTVIVYIQNGGGWEALPYTWGNLSISYGFSLESVRVYFANTDGSQTTNPSVQTFRTVIIPSSARLTNPNIDYTNYHEVKGAFNLD